MKLLLRIGALMCAVLIVQCPDRDEPDDPFQEPPPPPLLIVPFPDTAFPCDASHAVHFDWTAVPDAEIYELQTDTLDSFATTMTHQKNPPTQVTLHRYGPRTTYYWRVRAGNALWTTSYTDWSETRTFDLIPEARSK